MSQNKDILHPVEEKKQTANCNYFDGLMYISNKYSKNFNKSNG